jgi:hypothetical protein
MVDRSLMKGTDLHGPWLRCTICGELHRSPWDRLAVDVDGNHWDVCAGDCAVEAGIDQAPRAEQ